MPESMKPVLVTGTTGSTGSALVKLLSQRDVPVRVMVRREVDVTRVDAIPESVVVADFDDSESVTAAVHGIAEPLRRADRGRSGECGGRPRHRRGRGGCADRTRTPGPDLHHHGPAAITHREIAAALSEAVGREVTFVEAPPEVFAESLREVLPAWQIGGLLEDYAHYARGEAEAVHSTVADVTASPLP